MNDIQPLYNRCVIYRKVYIIILNYFCIISINSFKVKTRIKTDSFLGSLFVKLSRFELKSRAVIIAVYLTIYLLNLIFIIIKEFLIELYLKLNEKNLKYYTEYSIKVLIFILLLDFVLIY